METFEVLWKFCAENNRVCPIPMKWNELYKMLTSEVNVTDAKQALSPPLILAAWYEVPPLYKQLRFKEHIEFAEKYSQLNEIGKYLRSLTEGEWFHYGE